MNKIAKTIKASCKDDKVMCDFLLELLDLNLNGQQWYQTEYRKRISEYAKKYKAEESEDEN